MIKPHATRPRLRDFPVCLQLADRPVVVVGAGRVAARRIEGLLDAGARLKVVAPEGTARVAELAEAGRLEWVRRGHRDGDLAGAMVAFAATNSRDVNRAVVHEAMVRGILVNAADDPAACDFTMPAVGRHEELVLAVSTNGTNPGKAGRVRDALVPVLARGAADE